MKYVLDFMNNLFFLVIQGDGAMFLELVDADDIAEFVFCWNGIPVK